MNDPQNPTTKPWGADQATDAALVREAEADRLFAEREATRGRNPTTNKPETWEEAGKLLRDSIAGIAADITAGRTQKIGTVAAQLRLLVKAWDVGTSDDG